MDKGTKAKKITVISFVTNCILSIGKLLIGVFGNSGALVADGIHSFSDLITDVIVFISIKITTLTIYCHYGEETSSIFFIANFC